MIYILGSGKFTNFLTKKLNKKKFVLITSSKKSNKNIINVGNNLKKISQLKIDDKRSYCIINWSHTFIRKFDDFKYSIDGFDRISKFINNNPNLSYVFISSTSANLKVNRHSMYGLSKFIGEEILMNSKIINPKINIRIVRLGLLYGLDDCPIRKLLSLRKFYIEVYPGNPEKFFAVTDAEDISNYLINTKSEIWQSQQKKINFYESKKASLQYLYEKYNNYSLKIKPFFKFFLKSNSLLIKFSNFLGKKIDLDLAGVDRFPKEKAFEYLKIRGFENYIRKISI